MNLKSTTTAASILLAAITMAGCSPESGSQEAVTAMDPRATVAAANEESKAQDTVSELAGTSWRLVKIMGMDDSVAESENRSLYTLEFSDAGKAALLADCNRGTGSWTSEHSGQLQFGPIATTRAMCPPGSLSDKYLAQFEWVRSYVMRDGHLFLATMADGSIIELEPALAAPLAAIVLGEEVRTADAGEMQQIIITRLFDQYAADHGIEAAESEVSSFVEKLQRAVEGDENLAADDDLTTEEAEQVDAMRREMAGSMIRQWKLSRALYKQYGGRIIYQQLGAEPLDAYHQYLEERQAAGDFSIIEPAFVDEFWRYFTDDSMHSFFESGTEASAFVSPPWAQLSDSGAGDN